MSTVSSNRSRFSVASLLGLCLWALTLAGCTALRVVEIDNRPSEARGASIFVNGEKRGVTPARVQIDFGSTDQRVLIQVVKPNYKPAFQYWNVFEVPEKRVFDLEDE